MSPRHEALDHRRAEVAPASSPARWLRLRRGLPTANYRDQNPATYRAESNSLVPVITGTAARPAGKLSEGVKTARGEGQVPGKEGRSPRRPRTPAWVRSKVACHTSRSTETGSCALRPVPNGGSPDVNVRSPMPG